MNIIIVGAGRIGTSLAEVFVSENHNVYLIEGNPKVATKVSEKLDAKVIIGNGADPDVLLKANAPKADLVLGVTTSDETNLVVCALAAKLGSKRRIARVRNLSLSTTLSEFGYEHFSIDEIINPEMLAAEAIVRLVESPGADEVSDFADGRLFLRRFDIKKTSPLCGIQIGDIDTENFPWPFLIVSVIRDHEVIIPKGDTVIQEKDFIYVLLPSHSLAELLTFIDPEIKMPTKVVLFGASITGCHAVRRLKDVVKNLILIEENLDTATSVAEEFEDIRVIHGSAGENDILAECGVEAADAFIATTNNDHSNLISAVLAKKMNARETIIITQQPDYVSIVESLDIDAIINPHVLAVKQILHLVRGESILSVTKLTEGNAEIIELTPEEGSVITKSKLKDINFPKHAIIGAVYNKEEVILPGGETIIYPGQKVVVFCQKDAIQKVQKFFTKRKIF